MNKNQYVAQAITSRINIVNQPRRRDGWEWLRKVQHERLVDNAIKSGVAEYQLVKARAIVADAERRIKKANDRSAATNDIMEKADAESERIRSVVTAYSDRIAGMQQRLDAGLAQQAQRAANNARYEQDKIDKAEAAWSSKAGTTTDPDLRRAYLALESEDE